MRSNLHKHYSDLIIAKDERDWICGGQGRLKNICKRYNRAVRHKWKQHLKTQTIGD
jgi:hypothetical protein